MQGYTTLAAETLQQLEEQGAERPTHLFLQAGVGSFAGAALGFFTSVWGEERPVTAIVEPDRADCLFRTAQADDGALHFVTGDMDSMMAGLCAESPAPSAGRSSMPTRMPSCPAGTDTPPGECVCWPGRRRATRRWCPGSPAQ